MLRELRRKGPDHEYVSISAADPVNLTGIVLPGDRVSALSNNRILLKDGGVVATQVGKTVQFTVVLDDGAEWTARNALLGRKPADVTGPH